VGHIASLNDPLFVTDELSLVWRDNNRFLLSLFLLN
jgi:hypothetical protein